MSSPRITRIRVRETVPDSVIDRADDIELVDLTPEDLIQRLKEGKVYVPQQAERAIRHYFSPGNLTALRELALRRTAQRVDEQMVDYMRAHAISGPWAAGERILVCVGGTRVRRRRPLCQAPGRPAARAVERQSMSKLARPERSATLNGPHRRGCGWPQRLGARRSRCPVRTWRTHADYARANNFTHIVIGKPPGHGGGIFPGSLAHQLIRKAGGLACMCWGAAARQPSSADARYRAVRHRLCRQPCVRRHFPRDCTAAASRAGSLQRGDVLPDSGPGVRCRLWIVAGAACLFSSVLAYNFFFLPPLYTFTIADPENVAALFFFGVTAVIASNLTARVRAQAIVARQRARITEELYQFSRKLAGAANLDDLLWATVHQIA